MNPHELGQASQNTYDSQLQEKLALTQLEFAELYSGKLSCFASEPKHFRMRAEFRIWHNEAGANYAMYEPGKYKTPVIIDSFEIGSPLICDLMPKLLKAINNSSTLAKKLFQVEFLTTLSGEILTTLIYHKPLDEQWLSEARALQSSLGYPIIGRSRKQKEILQRDFVTETLALNVGNIHYKQIETGFTQPNAKVCIKMIDWACEKASELGGDLLELYCGNGNFTIPLSFHFDKVLATEVSKLSTRAALENIEANKRDNITLVRLSAEEVSEALSGVRAFRRLANVDLTKYQFSTVFVDPPRAGIDEQTLEFIRRFNNIIYISCNPVTLKRDLKHLNNDFDIAAMSLFDQFPYTEHRECGALLIKK